MKQGELELGGRGEGQRWRQRQDWEDFSDLFSGLLPFTASLTNELHTKK